MPSVLRYWQESLYMAFSTRRQTVSALRSQTQGSVPVPWQDGGGPKRGARIQGQYKESRGAVWLGERPVALDLDVLQGWPLERVGRISLRELS